MSLEETLKEASEEFGTGYSKKVRMGASISLTKVAKDEGLDIVFNSDKEEGITVMEK